jgi:hypothetical protein
MLLRCKQVGGVEKSAAFTLVEVLIATVLVTLFVGCILNGYVQSNRMAEWSSLSLAAQSLAAQGMEQARCAQWNSQAFPYASGPGTGDELPPTNYSLSGPDYALDVPATGAPFYATNYITVTNLTVASGAPLRIIRSDCVWIFPPTGKIFTNSMVTYRAPDQ